MPQRYSRYIFTDGRVIPLKGMKVLELQAEDTEELEASITMSLLSIQVAPKSQKSDWESR